MWLWPLALIFFAVMAALVPKDVRRPMVYTAAAIAGVIAWAIVADVARSLRNVSRQKQAMERIAPTQIQLDSLQLTGTAPAYRLSGQVHNLSPSYTLTDVVFELVVEDCVKGQCHEQARGHGEVIRRVPPNQSVVFESAIVSLPAIAQSLGERRLSYHVWTTYGLP